MHIRPDDLELNTILQKDTPGATFKILSEFDISPAPADSVEE